jgi:ParB-like chromosome segregation protein Spo0J
MTPVANQKLDIVYQGIDALAPYTNNARTHSQSQIRKIAESIRSFNFTNPILVDKKNTIIAGHGRVEAAKILGLAEVPTIRLESLTPAQVRAYVMADNRLALDAGWDDDLLKIEMQQLIVENEIDTRTPNREQVAVQSQAHHGVAGG